MYVDATTSENDTNVKANIINDYLVPRFEAALGSSRRYRLQTTEKAYSMHVIKTRNVYGCSIRKSCINHAVLELSGGRLAARNFQRIAVNIGQKYQNHEQKKSYPTV